MGVQDVEIIPDRLMAASSEKNSTFTASQGRITGNGHSWRPSSVLFYHLVVLLPVEQIIFALQLPPPIKTFFSFSYIWCPTLSSCKANCFHWSIYNFFVFYHAKFILFFWSFHNILFFPMQNTFFWPTHRPHKRIFFVLSLIPICIPLAKQFIFVNSN